MTHLKYPKYNSFKCISPDNQVVCFENTATININGSFVCARIRHSLPHRAVHDTPDTSQDVTGFLDHLGKCWVMLSWLLTSTPKPFSIQ